MGIGTEADQPLYAHLPLLHGPDGKKLSKRHGAASVQELRDAGYLPEAVRNYLALLGWGDADDETILSTEQLVERFSLDRVSKNPAQFDERKLRWLNGRYLRELPVDDLTGRLEAYTGRNGLREAVEISREKVQTLADFWPLAGFIFDGPTDGETADAARAKWLGEDGRAALADVRAVLAEVRSPSPRTRCRPPWRVSSRRARPSPSRSSSRSAWRSRAPPSHRESSRRSPSWGATRRSRGSTWRWHT